MRKWKVEGRWKTTEKMEGRTAKRSGKQLTKPKGGCHVGPGPCWPHATTAQREVKSSQVLSPRFLSALIPNGVESLETTFEANMILST